MKLTILFAGIIACILSSGCAGIPLPGEQTGTARYHPAGLSCGFPGGLLISSHPTAPPTVITSQK